MPTISISSELLQSEALQGKNAKLVYFHLLQRVRDNAAIVFSANAIAKEIGISEKTVRKIMQVFLESELVSESKSEQKSEQKLNKGKHITLCNINICDVSKQKKIGRKSELVSESKSEQKSEPITAKSSSKTLSKSEHEMIARFTPPTLEEVRQYISQKGYNVDAEKFVAYYESNGWMVGKNKMKKWQSALVTWNKNQYGTGQRTDTTGRYASDREANRQRVDNGLRAAMDVVAHENGF